MKISLIIEGEKSWHTKEVLKEAKKLGVKINVVAIRDLNDLTVALKKCGEILIWKSSGLRSALERVTFLNLIKNKIIINPSNLTHPFASRKIFQQKYVAAKTPIDCIPTFIFENKVQLADAISKNILKYPFIAKPNISSQGEGVKLIRNKTELKKIASCAKELVFQNFISNTGDYRVLVLGGKSLGAIKRVAKNGSFLNNVSQGASTVEISDSIVREKLDAIALMIASVFNLTFCGVDIIYDEKDKKYRFLEVNSVPQWQGFQKATGVNVARELVKLCIALGKRKKTSVSKLVLDYYKDNYEFLGKNKFHFSSRLYLWTRKAHWKDKVDKLERNFIGITDDDFEKAVVSILNNRKEINSGDDIIAPEIRVPYYKKYPMLRSYNKILFLSLFAETLYKRDTRAVLNKYLDTRSLLKIKNELECDRNAVASLSTIAVNFIYNLAWYLKDDTIAKPELFLDIAKNNYEKGLEEYQDLRVYLLTHCLIGESHFYDRKISRCKDVYMKMIKLIEETVINNYFELPLDPKMEYLVCSKLCGYKSDMEILIKAEAERSLAESGNFIISKLNDRAAFLKKNVNNYEHTNSLFVMANEQPCF